MAIVKIVIFFSILSIAGSLSAHVCDDVLRDDPIVVWPEKQIVEIVRTGEFRIFLRNEYWSSIHDVKIITPPTPFEFSVNPVLIERVKPREQVSFLVTLSIPEKVKPGRYPILMKVNAREFEVTRDINLIIRVKEPPKPEPQPEPNALIEIVPEEILVATTIFPEEIDIRPGKTKEFKAFMRSGYDKSLHNITLSLQPPDEFEITITPEVIQELKPGATRFFTLALYVPAETKFGEYRLRINFKAAEFPVERHLGDVLIRVSDVRDWKTPLYGLAILLLIGILLWRILRRQKLILGQK